MRLCVTLASVTSVTSVTKVNDVLHLRDATYVFSKSEQNFMIFFVIHK